MTTALQVVVMPAAAVSRSRLEHLTASGPFTICYLGNSYTAFEALARDLPPGWTMPVPGPLLNAAAERLRRSVIDLDIQAWPAGRNRLEWDASLLGERGPLASTMMINLARLVVFRQVLRQSGRHLIIADDVGFCRLLLREAMQNGGEAGWLAPGRRPDWRDYLGFVRTGLVGTVVGLRRRMSLLKNFIARKWKLTQLRRQHPVPLEALRTAGVVLTLWGRANTFPTQGRLAHENNYGRLPDILRHADFGLVYLVYPLTYIVPFQQILDNIAATSESVVLIEDVIPWWSIVPAIFSGLMFPRHIGKLVADGKDTSSLLRLEAVRDQRLASCAEAVLLRYVGPGLARLGARPELLLHLYEHQPWEKVLAAGVRRALPTTRVVGVQHAPFARNYLSFFPSRRALSDGASPDILLLSGVGYVSWFLAEGMPAERLRVVGALRYEGAMGETSPVGTTVLCCTGIDLDEAIELATKAARATDQTGLRLLVNFHPVTDAQFRAALLAGVDQGLGGRPEHVVFSPEPMRTLLTEAGTVLYTTSASCFEAILAGRRAIYVGRDLVLDYDKLPDDMARRVHTVEELRTLLLDRFEVGQQSAERLGQWLAPVVPASRIRALLV